MNLALASLIDHTLLRADATATDIDRVCEEARTYGFATVCVNGVWVSRAAARLEGSGVRVCTVVGFPLGAMASAAKAFEAREAVGAGASEVDMVLALGHVKAGAWSDAARDVEAVRHAVPKACLKLILETCLLTPEEKRQACALALAHGVDFVKTSTGFSLGGATVEDVRLMREVVGDRCGVKASGGIRTPEAAWALVHAGATRLGLSCSVEVVKGR